MVDQIQSLKCPRCDHYCTFDSLFCNRCGITLKGLIKTIPEAEVWEERVTLHVLWPVIFLYAVFAAAVSMIYAWVIAEPSTFAIVMFWFFLGAPAAWLIFHATRLKLTWRYRLTTQKFQVLRGWPTPEVQEVPLDKIDDVIVRQRFYHHLADVGRIMIVAPSAGHLRISGIRHPVRKKDLLQALVVAHRGE